MKGPLRIFAVLACSVPAMLFAWPADAVSISGNWEIHISVSGNESDMTCALTQTEGALSGKCASDAGTVNVTGKVDGVKVSFSYKAEYNGAPLTAIYEGAVTPDAKGIKGTVTIPEFSANGDFSATPAK